MARYTVVVTKSAQKQLAKLPNRIAELLEEAMLKLEDDPRPRGCVKLKGRDAYRIREGNYRIVYEIEDNVLLVRIIKVGNRKDIYLR